MSKIDDALKKLDEFLESPEGEAKLQEHFQKIKNREAILNSQLDRFQEKYGDMPDFLVILDKIADKYNQGTYVKSWYKRGYEPPYSLYFFLFEYAKKYGRECTKKEWREYGNTFTGELYFVHGHYFNLMHGQGSVIKILTQK